MTARRTTINPTTRRATITVLLALLVLAPSVGQAQGATIRLAGSEGYAQRPLTLPTGRLRVDFGPSDFGFMDHGGINNFRGLSILVPAAGDALVALGIGAALGVIPDLEIGTLLLPLMLSPDFDFGGIEVYGRYAFLRGDIAAAGQLTLRAPTDGTFGFGLGVPMLLKIGNSMRLDTGAELELLFYDGDTVANLDLPAAFSVEIAEIAFIGARTGALVVDFQDLDINLGVQAGVTIKRIVDITASFNWPLLLTTRGNDALNLDVFQVILGGTLHFDLYEA